MSLTNFYSWLNIRRFTHDMSSASLSCYKRRYVYSRWSWGISQVHVVLAWLNNQTALIHKILYCQEIISIHLLLGLVPQFVVLARKIGRLLWQNPFTCRTRVLAGGFKFSVPSYDFCWMAWTTTIVFLVGQLLEFDPPPSTCAWI